MAKKLVIPFGNYNIVAEIDASNLPDIPAELFVCVTDKNGAFVQDICLVRAHHAYNYQTNECETSDNAVDCIVWGDPDTDDATAYFTMNVREEE